MQLFMMIISFMMIIAFLLPKFVYDDHCVSTAEDYFSIVPGCRFFSQGRPFLGYDLDAMLTI